MNTLENKFIHKRWFLNSNLTNKQVIEYFASHMGNTDDYDFFFKKTRAGTVVKGLEDGSVWKPNLEQLKYLKERIKFYEKYYESHKDKYDYKNNWSEAMKQKYEDMINEIPEYNSFNKNFSKSLRKNREEIKQEEEDMEL